MTPLPLALIIQQRSKKNTISNTCWALLTLVKSKKVATNLTNPYFISATFRPVSAVHFPALTKKN